MPRIPDTPSHWHDNAIADHHWAEYPFALRTALVPRADPPKIGPDDNQLMWREIEVTLVIGGRLIGPGVRFPAHQPLTADEAFVAALRAVLAATP